MKLFDDLHAFLWADPAANNANTYLINGPKKILIDPGHAHLFGSVRSQLDAMGLSPNELDLVIATHAHPDHMEALRLFAEGPALVAFPLLELAFFRETAAWYGAAHGNTDFEPDLLLREGTLEAGGLSFEIHHAPGHSPGSICIYWPGRKALISGDVLFQQGIGRTDLPGGDGRALKETIRRLAGLDVDILLPGHGEAVLGRENVRRNFEEIQNLWFAYL